MRCPNLNELPPPPAGKTGWPWTEESPQLRGERPDGQAWPKISIVTPNYNYGQFIEETIRSVLLQGYPNLEYIVIDGGSTDGSAEVIKKYEKWLAYWVSEPDKGQSHAINKGFRQATGPIYNWLNSDDYFLKGALKKIASKYNPDLILIIGDTLVLSTVDKPAERARKFYRAPSEYYEEINIPQTSTFLCNREPEADENLNYCMDWALYKEILKDASEGQVLDLKEDISVFRPHPDSKTGRGMLPFFEEGLICQKKWLEKEKGLKRIAHTIIYLREKTNVEMQRLYAKKDTIDEKIFFAHLVNSFKRKLWRLAVKLFLPLLIKPKR